MKVIILNLSGAEHAWIQTDAVSLNICLARGKDAADSLRESAQKMRDKAELLVARAALIEEAAEQVHNINYP